MTVLAFIVGVLFAPLLVTTIILSYGKPKEPKQ